MKKICLILLALSFLPCSAFAQVQTVIKEEQLFVGDHKIYYDSNGNKVNVTAIGASSVSYARGLDDEALWARAYYDKVDLCFIGAYYELVPDTDLRNYTYYIGKGSRDGDHDKIFKTSPPQPTTKMKSIEAREETIRTFRLLLKNDYCIDS